MRAPLRVRAYLDIVEHDDVAALRQDIDHSIENGKVSITTTPQVGKFDRRHVQHVSTVPGLELLRQPLLF